MEINASINELLQIAKAIAAICLGINAGLGPTVFVARWILTPIDRAAKSREAPVRFSIGDFLCLFILIQIPLAAIFRLQDSTEDGDVRVGLWVLTAILWGVGTVIWYAGARTLSKAGVAATGNRFVYLGLILPLVYYGLVPYTFLSCSGVAALFNAEQPTWTVGWGFAAWTILTLLYGLSAIFTHWMIGREQFVELELIDTVVVASGRSSHNYPMNGSTMPESGSIPANGQPSQLGRVRLQ
jgi:hypothetical protein